MEVHFDGAEPHARSVAIQGGVDVQLHVTASTEALQRLVKGLSDCMEKHGETWEKMEEKK